MSDNSQKEQRRIYFFSLSGLYVRSRHFVGVIFSHHSLAVSVCKVCRDVDALNVMQQKQIAQLPILNSVIVWISMHIWTTAWKSYDELSVAPSICNEEWIRGIERVGKYKLQMLV